MDIGDQVVGLEVEAPVMAGAPVHGNIEGVARPPDLVPTQVPFKDEVFIIPIVQVKPTAIDIVAEKLRLAFYLAVQQAVGKKQGDRRCDVQVVSYLPVVVDGEPLAALMHDVKVHVIVAGSIRALSSSFFFIVKAGRIFTELQPVVVAGQVADSPILPAKSQFKSVVGEGQLAIGEVDGLIVDDLVNGGDFTESDGVQLGVDPIVCALGEDRQ